MQPRPQSNKTSRAESHQDLPPETVKLKKKERNRAAAYKSRQKHTQRADILHQEYEKLETDNNALRKEIEKLQQEQEYLTKILQQHEEACLRLPIDIIWELQNPGPLFSPKETTSMTFDL
ncbi:basic leucine zipper transcriptional factor ATF-like 2 isoform X2 [Hyperolius riggenbachi]|uniref:basic leucine zipper transcriptional factor ATF-like 2 isoform X2 n=1 Tax=Hyperolius riggenbachi TaxID=752182 RepID=UPI0035A2C373